MEHLQSIFNEFLFCGGNPVLLDNDERSPLWKETMTLLAGAVLQYRLRGYVGSAAQVKWT